MIQSLLLEEMLWLVDPIEENSRTALQTGKLNTKFIIGGQVVCLSALCKLLLTSPRRVSRHPVKHSNKRKRKCNTISESAKAWM